MDKKLLRQQMNEVRVSVQNSDCQNARIFENARKLIAELKCEKIFTYVSMGNEVDTKTIISYYFNKGNFKVFVPQTQGGGMLPVLLTNAEFLETDKLGNLKNATPISTTESLPDIALVPLLCYNKDNYRLGYGGGYYDRYLAKHSIISAGLAFNEQFCAKLIPEQFDIPLDYIITANSIIKRGIYETKL